MKFSSVIGPTLALLVAVANPTNGQRSERGSEANPGPNMSPLTAGLRRGNTAAPNAPSSSRGTLLNPAMNPLSAGLGKENAVVPQKVHDVPDLTKWRTTSKASQQKSHAINNAHLNNDPEALARAKAIQMPRAQGYRHVDQTDAVARAVAAKQEANQQQIQASRAAFQNSAAPPRREPIIRMFASLIVPSSNF
jgi:hypothetical protein